MNMFDTILPAALVEALPVIANADHAPLEGGEDPAFGTVRWRTLFSADKTETKGMVVGVAEFGPEGTLNAHRHAHAEVYFGLAGSGHVTIDGVAHELSANVALYIPTDAEHVTAAGPEGLRFLYMFAADRFSDVQYRFSVA